MNFSHHRLPNSPSSRTPGTTRLFFVILALFLLGNATFLAVNRPWQELEKSNWPCGYEAGRIASHLLRGAGYTSPFALLSGEDLPVAPAGKGQETPLPPTSWMTPPYVFLWALCFAVFGVYAPSAWAAFLVLQTLIMAGAVWVFRDWVRSTSSTRAADLAGTALLLYPPVWRQAAWDTHGTALFLLFTALALVVYQKAAEGRRHLAFLGGLAAGLAILAEPASLLFFAGCASSILWSKCRSRNDSAKRFRRLLAWLFTGACVAVIPWGVRNAAAFQAPVFLKSNFAMEFHYGNNQEALQDIMGAHARRFAGTSEMERARLLRMGEAEYGRWCWRAGFSFVREQPGAFASLCFRRVYYFWGFQPYKDATNPFRRGLNVLFIGVLAGWAAGWAVSRRGKPDQAAAVSLLFLAAYPVAYYFTHFTEVRYRFPVEVMAVIGMVTTLTAAWEARKAPVDTAKDT